MTDKDTYNIRTRGRRREWINRSDLLFTLAMGLADDEISRHPDAVIMLKELIEQLDV